MCTNEALGTDQGTSSAIVALWCTGSGANQSVTHGTCVLDVSGSTLGNCKYTTTCDAGWYITETTVTSQNKTTTATTTGSESGCLACETGIPYKVYYKAGLGGSETDESDSVPFGSSFTTKASTTFTKANATFQQWECSGTGCGGSSSAFATAGTSYTYNKGAGDATLTAIWKCNAGYYLPTDSTTCTDVDDGYYSPASDNSRYSCVTKTIASTNTSATSSIYSHSVSPFAAITDCAAITTAKKYVKTAKDLTETTCTAGYYCPGSVTVKWTAIGGRTPCAKGYYQNSTGQSACKACAKGSYTASTAQTTCTACDPGETTTNTASNAATLCIDCASISHLATWGTQTFDKTNNTVTGLCTVATCEASTSTNPASLTSAGITYTTTGNTCNYTGTCADGYHETGGPTTCTGWNCACPANIITLDWDEKGGSSVTNGSCSYSGSITFPSTKPTQSGKTFNGWSL